MLIVPKENWQRVANIVEVSWNKISGYFSVLISSYTPMN